MFSSHCLMGCGPAKLWDAPQWGFFFPFPRLASSCLSRTLQTAARRAPPTPLSEAACAEQNLSIRGLCTIPAQSHCHLQTVQPPVLPPRHTGCASPVCCSQESLPVLRTGQAVSERCDYKLMRSALCKQPQQKVCNPSQC